MATWFLYSHLFRKVRGDNVKLIGFSVLFNREGINKIIIPFSPFMKWGQLWYLCGNIFIMVDNSIAGFLYPFFEGFEWIQMPFFNGRS